MDHFSESLNRLNIEWLSLVAIREAVGTAMGEKGTYKETLRLAEKLAPVLFHKDRSLLFKEWESQEARECRAIANTRSISFNIALKQEIERYSELEKLSKDEDRRLFSIKLSRLRKIREETKSKEFYEGKLISDDSAIGTDLPLSRRGDGYVDFALPLGRAMRIRVTHETAIEAINGADVIYENHWIEERKARVAAIQYKIRAENRALPKAPRFRKQVEKLHDSFCKKLPCIQNDSKDKQFFRLPTCSAFIRATNKRQQRRESNLMSVGHYVPVCRIKTMWDAGLSLSPKVLETEGISYRVYEELFNSDLLGSEWIPYDKLEAIYKQHRILELEESVAIHVQVIPKFGEQHQYWLRNRHRYS